MQLRPNWRLVWGSLAVLTVLVVATAFFRSDPREGAQSVDQEVVPAQYRPTLWTTPSWQIDLLARVVAGEASGEPYTGQVAVAAVILNRVASPSFPRTLSSVIYQPLAFESVSNGHIWWVAPKAISTGRRAARDALAGWDPTWGSLYFWNPAKRVNPWVWTRRIVSQIGRHVFAR